jgi:hypothetical protein
MSAVVDVLAPVPLEMLSAEEAAAVGQEMDELFWIDPPGQMPAIESRLRELAAEASGLVHVKEARGQGLRALWHFFEGWRLLQTEANAAAGQAHLHAAVQGFALVGHTLLRDLAHGLGEILGAQVDLQNLNIDQARQRLERAREHMAQAGQFSQRCRPLLDRLQPRHWYAAGMQAIVQQDFSTAQACFSEAARTAENVARTYHAEHEAGHHRWLGQAHLFRAMWTLHACYRHLTLFEYGDVIERDNTADAGAARALLAQALVVLADEDQTDGETEALNDLAEVLILILEGLTQMARVLSATFAAAIKRGGSPLESVRQQFGTARERASRLGPTAAGLCRMCDSLLQRVANIQKLAAVKLKDFAILTGLVSCAASVVVQVILLGITGATGAEMQPVHLLAASAGLGLACGFGHGAVRFRGLFFPRDVAQE